MPQETEHWDLLQTLYHLAEETPAEDRARVLAEHCSDAALVERVLAILHRSELLDKVTKPAKEAAHPDSNPGRMGPWTPLRIIGTGGIGTVYLAERIFAGAPQRTALKVLAPHAAGPSFVERFRREQHILGSLDHPHITRLLDAGISDEGQPYLVMEFVDGEHLDAYCDAHNLSIEQRIGLFVQMCDALAYAHRNLIVHLDLKPSNILVTHEGSVKLLDFGTSKLIEMDARLTTTLLATPAYASPEQLRNEPVTTACDVYALGAILFELLCGQRPYAKSSVAAMLERAMQKGTPERVTDAVTADAAQRRGISENRLRQILIGDLSTIVAKCLEPLPRDRYASVDALSDDVRRFIEGRPILARPQTTFYRVSKFVRRNRKIVTAGVVAVALLLGALGFAELKQRKAIEAGRRAEQMQTMLFALFTIAHSQNLGRPTMSVNDFLNLGVKTLPLYIHNRADLRAGQMSLAVSLYQDSDYADAQKVFLESVRSAREDGDINAEAESLAYAGDIAFRQGSIDDGKQLTARAMELARSPKVSPAARVAAKRFYAESREVNGLHSDENLRLMQEAVREAEDSKLPASDIAHVLESLGVLMRSRNRWDDAASYYKQAVVYYARDPAYTCNSAELNGELGRIERMQGDFNDALAQNRYAFDTVARCTGAESADALVEEKYVAQDLILLGRAPEAARIMENVVHLERQHDPRASGSQLANALYVLASADVAIDKPEEGGALVREEMEMAKGKLDPSSFGFGLMDLLYARALTNQHRDQEALPYAEMANHALERVGANDSYLDKRQAAEAKQLVAVLRGRLKSP